MLWHLLFIHRCMATIWHTVSCKKSHVGQSVVPLVTKCRAHAPQCCLLAPRLALHLPWQLRGQSGNDVDRLLRSLPNVVRSIASNQRQRRGQPVAVRDNRQAPVESSPPLRTPAATRLACAPDLEDHFYDRRYTTTTTIYGPRLHANAALHKCKPSSNKVCGDGNRPAAAYAERSPPMELPPALTPAPLSSPRWPRAAGPPPCRPKPCQLLNRRQFPMPTS